MHSFATTVESPEGLEAGCDSLTEEVNAEIEVIQFTLTDAARKLGLHG